MPYAIAHPAAVIPLHRWLGRFSVPSALAIGSVIPDAWYFVPFLDRPDTHAVPGVLLYCLPLALLAYAVFHLVMKQPLLALCPPALAARMRAYACDGLPRASWLAVALSAAAGALTHVAWDGLTHEGPFSWHVLPVLEASLFSIGSYDVRVHQLLQHLSTLLGAAFLAWWAHRKLRQARPETSAGGERAPAVLAVALAAIPAAVLLEWLPEILAASGLEALRGTVRAAAISAAAALGLAFMAYCLLWRARRLLSWNRRTTP